MKVNKLFGVKSITNLLYGMLLMLPFVSVLSRVIYVQANPSAIDSYSDSRIVSQTSLVSRTGNLETGLLYDLRMDLNLGQQNTQYFSYSQISIDWTEYGAPSSFNYDGFGVYTASTTNYYVYLRENGSNVHVFWEGANKFGTNWNLQLVSSANTTLNGSQPFNIYFNSFVTEKLDNAFEYSLSTFVDEYDNQSINFFGWFTDLFLNQNKPHNALYLNFANWYMNYTLLVSTGYLLFFALLWFINYVRKILEKSSYHDFGGF